MISKSFVKVVIQLLHFELDTLIKRPVIYYFSIFRDLELYHAWMNTVNPGSGLCSNSIFAV